MKNSQLEASSLQLKNDSTFRSFFILSDAGLEYTLFGGLMSFIWINLRSLLKSSVFFATFHKPDIIQLYLNFSPSNHQFDESESDV